MRVFQYTILLSAWSLGLLSAAPVSPQLTLDHNPLLDAKSGVRLNTDRKFIRIDRGAQLSGVFTSLLPDALRYSVLDPAASASVPESPVVGNSTSPSVTPDMELIGQAAQIRDFVWTIGRSLPRQAYLLEISRELLGIQPDGELDIEHMILSAANLLASAFSRG